MTLQDKEAPNKKVQQGKVEDSILGFCISSKSKKEIADYLNLKDIRHLTESYLKPLIEKGNILKELNLNRYRRDIHAKSKYKDGRGFRKI